MNIISKYIGSTALALALCPSLMAYAQSDSIVNVAFGTLPKEDVINAVSSVNMEELLKKNFTNDALDGSLRSIIGGYTGQVWGQDALVLVDGMPRDASDVLASEVESVSVLKDAAAVALYGSRAAKGVILITTKRGNLEQMRIDFRANAGFYVPKKYPKFIDAASYMTLYNEACRNDGLSERYDAATIYNTAIGANPYRYPDQKYYNDEYLRKFSNAYGANGEIRGGNERTHYYMNVGLNYSNGLIKVGDHKNDKTLRFNVRGNVDMKITDWLKGFTNASVLVNDDYASRGDFWDMASSTWPNRFGVLIPIDMVDPNNSDLQDMIGSATLIDGRYLLGGTSQNPTNAIADALEAGYVKTKTRTFLFDVGLDFDLKSILDGLSFKTAFGVDYRSVYSEGFSENYAVYEPVWGKVNGKDMIVNLNKYGNDTNSTNEFVGQSTYYQNMMFRGQFDYHKVFDGLHQVDAMLMGWGYQTHNSADADHDSSSFHNLSNVNAGLQVSYNFDHRYYATLTGVLVRSSKFAPGKRNAFSPAVTLGWRLGQEKFLRENASWIDDLKLTASAAKLHQDIDVSDWYLWKRYFGYKHNGGWLSYQDGNVGMNTSMPKQGDNLDLTFITREEFRVGLEGSFLNGLLSADVNWFIQDTKGGLTRGDNSLYPSYLNIWDSNYLPWINYNNDRRHGVDFSIRAVKNFGEWELAAGFSGMYLSQKATQRDEMVRYDYLSTVDRPLNSAFGYICEGFFQSQDEIDSRNVRQTFGGTLRPGDLKYKDINNDGVVDSNDRVYLGTYTPKFYYGINITAKWRNWTLFAYGTGHSGAVSFNNGSYYNNGGESKYSENAWLRWTPATAATAAYPRLTTGSTANNNQTSTFWRYSTDRFDLARVQLTYDFSPSLFTGKVISGISLYVEGENLATIAKERKILEMSTYPQSRYYNMGCKLSF